MRERADSFESSDSVSTTRCLVSSHYYDTFVQGMEKYSITVCQAEQEIFCAGTLFIYLRVGPARSRMSQNQLLC